MLRRSWNVLCTVTSVLSAVCTAQYGCFCSSLISCFPPMLLRYCLSDFEMVPFAPLITVITFAFTFHMRWVSFMRSLYLRIFSSSFLITFVSPGIATSSNTHFPFLLSRIMMSGLLLGIVLSVCTCWFRNAVPLTTWLVLTHFGTWSYQCSLSNFAPISLHMLQCSWAHKLCHVFQNITNKMQSYTVCLFL